MRVLPGHPLQFDQFASTRRQARTGRQQLPPPVPVLKLHVDGCAPVHHLNQNYARQMAKAGKELQAMLDPRKAAAMLFAFFTIGTPGAALAAGEAAISIAEQTSLEAIAALPAASR